MSGMDEHIRETGTERVDLPHEPQIETGDICSCGRRVEHEIHETGDAPHEMAAAARIRELGS